MDTFARERKQTYVQKQRPHIFRAAVVMTSNAVLIGADRRVLLPEERQPDAIDQQPDD